MNVADPRQGMCSSNQSSGSTQALRVEQGQQSGLGMAVEIFEALAAFGQDIDLVPGAQLIGRAIVAIAPDRRVEDCSVTGVMLGPLLQVIERQKIGVGVFVRLLVTVLVGAALP